jgi:hypothetical protein
MALLKECPLFDSRIAINLALLKECAIVDALALL